MQKFIVNASNELLNNSNRKTINRIANDLKLITASIPQIDNIVLRGGAAVDILSNIEPNDVDLLYSYLSEGKHTFDCVCKKVRDAIQNLNFEYINLKNLDLENVYEKEPRLNPIERSVGIFSYHTEYYSQFVIDMNGCVWTNAIALDHYKNKQYEIRYEGFLPWAYFPQDTDTHDYWGFYTSIILRGIGYISKRDLVPGPNFMWLFKEYEYIIPKGIRILGLEKLRAYALSKIKNQKTFLKFLNDFIDSGEHKKVLEVFNPIISELPE